MLTDGLKFGISTPQLCVLDQPCADPGGGGGPDTPEKLNNIGFLSNP